MSQKIWRISKTIPFSMIEMMRDFDQNYLSTASDLPMSANIVHSYVKQTVSDFFEHYGYESLQNF